MSSSRAEGDGSLASHRDDHEFCIGMIAVAEILNICDGSLDLVPLQLWNILSNSIRIKNESSEIPQSFMSLRSGEI